MTNRVVEEPKKKPMITRLQKLRTSAGKERFDALLVSQPENRRYLSGFTGSSGWLLVSKQKAILATDFRYVEQAKGESPDFEIVQTKGELHDWLPGLISDSGWNRLGFEANCISYDSHHKLTEAIETKHVDLELIPTTGLVEELRAIKEPGELDSITRAVALADAALEQAKAIIRPGITEKEAAWEIEKLLRQEGSEGIAFEIIVASGPNSALPHARPTERTIQSGEPVLIDMGARFNGYCSDLSRTLFFGQADNTLRRIYDIVLRAQTAAIEGVEAGMDAAQADRLARRTIEQAGYGDAFGHGLGHGVGLAVHESPRLGFNSSDSLLDGMVFTIEPGIYLVGQGGIRIEDMAVLENGKARVLTGARKDSPQPPALGNQ
ncbi:MAG: aminopeptidase P family protein [Dehalococcoidia bacterium]|nr:MAG: aminopeptidase P family protein [Dehalococcoidia bacterium]